MIIIAIPGNGVVTLTIPAMIVMAIPGNDGIAPAIPGRDGFAPAILATIDDGDLGQ